ncbi:TetR/AcrR family transcriptional regulator [Lactococcus termiticola]|uniref:TetR family transcriptional regulator n=1 Tax=Lactococcus termiticola TaxID=2169526 RepID=A0A2R5HFL0_9LACT|nr:TetR/AcrR family transcriptional regulator [Lactococcus termiticola]GBG96626.1 TetR family transcriptional regulator [Lactococcus termiticola]
MAKLDLRIKRTRSMIRQAFFELLRKKKFEKISIQEIADTAMINRATFYAHYADKEDLYDSLIDDFIIDFIAVLDEVQPVEENRVQVKKLEGMLSRFYSFVRLYPELAEIVIDKAQDEKVIVRFLAILNERYESLLAQLEVREEDIIVPNDFVLSYILSILTGTMKWWVNADSQSMSPDDFARLIIKLISNGHLTVLGVNIERDI